MVAHLVPFFCLPPETRRTILHRIFGSLFSTLSDISFRSVQFCHTSYTSCLWPDNRLGVGTWCGHSENMSSSNPISCSHNRLLAFPFVTYTSVTVANLVCGELILSLKQPSSGNSCRSPSGLYEHSFFAGLLSFLIFSFPKVSSPIRFTSAPDSTRKQIYLPDIIMVAHLVPFFCLPPEKRGLSHILHRKFGSLFSTLSDISFRSVQFCHTSYNSSLWPDNRLGVGSHLLNEILSSSNPISCSHVYSWIYQGYVTA